MLFLAAFALLAGGRVAAVHAETVALGSFAHAEFERNDPGTSAALAAAVQAGLEGKARWKFVQRGEVDRLFDELALSRHGLVPADTAARVGKLLKADLMLSGTVFTPQAGKAYAMLECEELLRAEPVGQVRVELDKIAEQGHLIMPAAADLQRIVAAAADLLEKSTALLAAQRDRTVLKLLFLADRTPGAEPGGLERTVVPGLEQVVSQSTLHRLLRFPRRAVGTTQNELALLGLVEADSTAWSQVADYYLWGYYRVTDGQPGLTLVLWDGQQAPQEFTEAVGPDGLNALAARLARQVIAAASPVIRKPGDDAGGAAQRLRVSGLLAGRARELTDLGEKTKASAAGQQAALVEERRLLASAIFFAPTEKGYWITLAGLRGIEDGSLGPGPALLRKVDNLEFGQEVAERFLVSADGRIDMATLRGAASGLATYTDPVYGLISDLNRLPALRDRVMTGYRKRTMQLGRRVATAAPGNDEDYRQAMEFILTNALQLPFTSGERDELIDALWPRVKIGDLVQRAWNAPGVQRHPMKLRLRDYYFSQHQSAKADALDVLSPGELTAALALPPSTGSPAAEILRLIPLVTRGAANMKEMTVRLPNDPSFKKNYEHDEARLVEMRAAYVPLPARAAAYLYNHSEAGGGPGQAELLQGPVAQEIATATDLTNPEVAAKLLVERARVGDLPNLQALLARGVPVQLAGPAFVAAIEEEQWPAVTYLLDRGYNPAALAASVEAHQDDLASKFSDQPGRIALAKAAIAGRKELVALLLKGGVQFDNASPAGSFAVTELTKRHRTELLRQLLAVHASPNPPNDSLKPLFFAVRDRDLEALKLLVEAGGDPAKYPGQGWIQSAALTGRASGVERDGAGAAKTILDYCAQENWLEGTEALLLAKSDLREALAQNQPHRRATDPAVRDAFLRAEKTAAASLPARNPATAGQAATTPAVLARSVALGAFAHADFERNDPDTSAALATAVQAGLDTKGRWKFVERAETDRIFAELGLSRHGLASADTAARVGKLLKADLMLSGTIFTPKGGKPYVMLECDELLRAEPVAEARVDVENVLERGHLAMPSPADLQRIVAAAAELLESSAARLAAQRDRTVLKLLFLSNHTNDASLNGYERLVSAGIDRAATASGTHRLLRLDRPEIGTHENELALLGLVEADSKAWSQVADYYLWGSYQITNGELSLTVTLWDGQQPPRELTETVGPDGLDALADRMIEEVISAAVPVSRKPADDTGEDQRRKVADLLAGHARELLIARGRKAPSPTELLASLAEERRLLAAAIFFAPEEKANWISLLQVRLTDPGRIGQLPLLFGKVDALEFGTEVAERFLVSADGKIDHNALGWVWGYWLEGDFSSFQENLQDAYVGRNLLALQDRIKTNYRLRLSQWGQRLATTAPGQAEEYRQAAEPILTGALYLHLADDAFARLMDALWPRLKIANFAYRAWYPSQQGGVELENKLREYYVGLKQNAKADALRVLSPAELAAALKEPVPAGCPAAENTRMAQEYKRYIAENLKRAEGRPPDANNQKYIDTTRKQIADWEAAARFAAVKASAYLYSHSEAGGGPGQAELLAGPIDVNFANSLIPFDTYPTATKRSLIRWLRSTAASRAGEGYPAAVLDRMRNLADAWEKDVAADPQGSALPIPPNWSDRKPDILDPLEGGRRMYFAAIRDDLPALKALLAQGAPIEAAGEALVGAIREEQWAAATYLLERGYDPAAPWVRMSLSGTGHDLSDLPGRIALMEAVLKNRQDMIQLLLSRGVVFDRKSASGTYTTLQLAKNHRPELLGLILKAQGRPVRQDGGMAPLAYAIQAHDLESLKLLMNAGGDAAEYPGWGSSQSEGLGSSTQWMRLDETRKPKTLLDYCAKENWLEGAQALLALSKTNLREALVDYHPYHFATVASVRAVFLHAELAAMSPSPDRDRAGLDLFTAITAGDQSGFVAALAVPGSMDFRGVNGETALMLACEERQPGMARQLLDAGAPLDAFDVIGSTPLCYAARNGDIELAEAMIRKGADINLSQGRANRPLDQAIMEGRHSEMALKLLQLGASFAPHPRKPDLIPLFQATIANLPEVVRELLRRGADPHATPGGLTILFPAARSNNPDLIQLYIDLNCNLNGRTPDDKTALFTAVRWGAPAAVRKLLELGLRDEKASAVAVNLVKDIDPPNRPDPSQLTRLHYIPDYRTCLEIMEEFGQISGSKSVQGNLFWRDRHTLAEIDAFLAAGGDVNYREGKQTPLQIALERDDAEAIYLLSKGADPNLRGLDPNESSPMRRALSRPKTLEQLLKYGANPNLVTHYFNGDKSILGDACISAPVESIRLLIRYGANPDIDARKVVDELLQKDDPRGLEQIKAALNGQ